MENQFWAVGRWPGLDCVIKGFGPIMSNFFEWFFQFFRVKKNFENFFENTIASALKSCIIKNIKKISKNFFYPEKVKKPVFFRAKNLSVNT